MKHWPFRDEENTAVITTLQVMEARAPILRVTHDADDGSWQFLPSGTPQEADARVLSLLEITDLDPSIVELADLPEGWVATRPDTGTKWNRSKNTDG